MEQRTFVSRFSEARVCIAPLIAAMCATAPAAHAQAPIGREASLSGLWESASRSGVDGIFVKIDENLDANASLRQTVQVRAYHRQHGRESWGWYVVSPAPSATTAFDGVRLRVAGLTATFKPETGQWTGTWSLNGETRRVVLERPHLPQGVTPSPVCGDWDGVPGVAPMAGTTLHLVQSADGRVSAWMNRFLSRNDQRFGEPLVVVTADPEHVVLQLDTAIGRPYRFDGALSSDRNTLHGQWDGLNADGVFQRRQ